MQKLEQIDTASLLYKYLPFDYYDIFSKTIENKDEISPQMFLDMCFNEKNSPWWVRALLCLRNKLVKPFGLKVDGRMTDMICDKNENEIILGMKDKHLSFYVSLWSGKKEQNIQNLKITTIVQYQNMFGKVYFFIIYPFHKIIIRNMIKKL